MRFKIILFVGLFFTSILSHAGEYSPKLSTHWKSGLVVGAVAGGLTGGAITGVLILNAASKDDSCGNGAFCGVSGAAAVTGWVVGSALAGGAVGAGIGALIGSAIPKMEKTVSLAPFMSMEGHTAGAVVRGVF